MKKFFLTVLMAVGFVAGMSAQPRAIGARLSYGGEISYQHSMGSNFAEFDGGWMASAFGARGIYDIVLASPSWTEGTWNVYAGPGVGVFLGDYLGVSICGQLGLEYKFASIPLQFSIDTRPDIVSFGDGMSFLHGWYPGFSIRYSF